MSNTDETTYFDDENNASLTTVDKPVGTQMTLERTCESCYKTSSGQKVFSKILTGTQKILFPTTVDANACFEYKFSVKNLMLPSQLPEVTGMFFQYLTVKFQDVFTNVMSSEAIKNGLVYSYDPYSAVICQDADGLEFVANNVKVGEKTWKRKFINSDRVVKRDDNSLYAVSSNLKIEKQINLTTSTSPYRILILYNKYDMDGNFEMKVLKSAVSCTKQDLNQAIKGFDQSETANGGLFCTDIILCDVLVFMLKTCNLSNEQTPYLENIRPEHLAKARKFRTVPMGWLTPEEKLEKYGKKGVYMDTFVANKTGTNDISTYNYDAIPNNLFIHVDMQEVCEKLFSIARPQFSVFNDEQGIVIGGGIKGQYAIAHEMISVSIKADN